jgi:DNA-directed RNA polymerase subunit RPC12/RpoP
MSSVIDIKVWRDAHIRNAAPQESAAEALFCCMGCGSKLFRIDETGLVRCARCSARVRIPSAQATVKPGRWIRIMRGLFMREQ